MVVNTRMAWGARVDGYEIRTVAVRLGIPCITTAQGLAAAVEGIESMLAGEISVRSLQQHAADLTALRTAQAASGEGLTS